MIDRFHAPASQYDAKHTFLFKCSQLRHPSRYYIVPTSDRSTTTSTLRYADECLSMQAFCVQYSRPVLQLMESFAAESSAFLCLRRDILSTFVHCSKAITLQWFRPTSIWTTHESSLLAFEHACQHYYTRTTIKAEHSRTKNGAFCIGRGI